MMLSLSEQKRQSSPFLVERGCVSKVNAFKQATALDYSSI